MLRARARYRAAVSTTELVRWLIDGGTKNAMMLALLPMALGAAAAGSKHGGHARLSQLSRTPASR